MLSNQKNINENREKEIKKLQSDIDEFQKERVQHLECTKAVKGKLEEEQGTKTSFNLCWRLFVLTL